MTKVRKPTPTPWSLQKLLMRLRVAGCKLALEPPVTNLPNAPISGRQATKPCERNRSGIPRSREKKQGIFRDYAPNPQILPIIRKFLLRAGNLQGICENVRISL
jgi:hypothetical protein